MQERIKKIVDLLDNKKGENIISFNFIDTDYFCDSVVVCNSLNSRHGDSLINEMKNVLKPQEEFLNVDDKSMEWIIADLGDIIVHIIDPSVRDMYKLDEFFSKIQKV
jgi:ribosome silencing factor RsfS/YbeB/iojap